MSWDEKTGLIRNDEPVRTILSNGVTNYFFKLRAAKGNSKHHKDLEEVVFSRVIQEDILPKLLPEMIDIVITTGSKSLDMLFLEDWKEFIIGMHCIIIQEGDPERSIAIPNWLNYELYTSKDVRRAVGDLEWLFDLDEDGQKGDSSGVSSAANFGFLVSDRDYIFLLNRHTPISAVSKENEKNELSVLLQHVDNLIMPSAPYYFNTFFDDYKHSGEMPSGYPHSLRDGVETALSHGVVDVSCDYDAAATIFKGHTEETYARVPQEDTRRQLRDTPAVTIPARSLFSLSLQNLAFSRNLLGPAFFLLGSPSASLLKKYPHKRVDHHLHQQIYQQITGWMLKVICDQLGIGVKAFKLHRSDSVADSIIGKSDIPCIHREDAFARLKGDLIWDDKAEEVVRWFSSITLSKVGNVAKASNELLDLMERDLVNIHPVFREIVEMKRAYTVLYEKRNIFNINEYIDFRASRSSYGPKATIYDDVLLKKAKEETEDESPPPFRSRQQGAHQCAIFTIVRNDTEMLSWFTRYYSQHFPTKDIYVLNHNPTTPDTFLYPGSDNISMKTVFSGDRRFIRVINLYGDAAGFPFYYFVSYADKYQRRLFRWGYQCVILADVDEIAVVNAEVYPQGLAEYLSNWVFNTTQNYIRADGRSIAHISEPDDTVGKYL